MERDKNKCIQNNKQPINYSNLDFVRCVFFTDEQYNKNKIHIPQQSLIIENNLNIPLDDKENSLNSSNKNPLNIIENKINENINFIYEKLNKDKDSNATPFKIPMPIFALIGRTIEYTNSIFEEEKIEVYPDNSSIAIIDFFKNFLSSETATAKDKDKYNNGIINKYNFNGNVKLYLYVPYLTKDYLYVSNFRDISNSILFFYSLINSDFFLNFKRTTHIDKEFISNLRKKGIDKKFIDYIITILSEADRDKYTLYDDLINLCYDGGCISDIGEDIESLIPQYTSDEAKNSENATKFSPFLPNKCLSKTNGYICNVQYAVENNRPRDILLKEEAMKDIREGLKKYTEIDYLIKNKQDIKQYRDEIDKYKSPVNLIYSIINKTIKDKYSDNANDDGKNIYSKKYSENIIKELSILQKLHPGIPEVILSLYMYKDNLNTDKIAYMPWGRRLLSSKYLLYLDYEFNVNSILYSMNNKYALTFIPNGFIYVYEVSNNKILYFLNRNIIMNSVSMIISSYGISVSFLNNENIQKSKGIFDNNISFVNNCDICKSPFTIIIDDETGNLIIYGNSFINSTGSALTELINNERQLIINKDIDINNLNDLNDLNIGNIKPQEKYLFCSELNSSCLK